MDLDLVRVAKQKALRYMELRRIEASVGLGTDPDNPEHFILRIRLEPQNTDELPSEFDGVKVKYDEYHKIGKR